MQVTLEIKGDNAFSILQVLKNIKGVSVKSIDKDLQLKQQYLDELKGALKDVKLAKQGKLKLKNFDDLMNEI